MPCLLGAALANWPNWAWAGTRRSTSYMGRSTGCGSDWVRRSWPAATPGQSRTSWLAEGPAARWGLATVGAACSRRQKSRGCEVEPLRPRPNRRRQQVARLLLCAAISFFSYNGLCGFSSPRHDLGHPTPARQHNPRQVIDPMLAHVQVVLNPHAAKRRQTVD